MFIYFWEQVWGDEHSVNNFETEEVSRCYWDQHLNNNRKNVYPTTFMEEGVDYYDY